MSLDPCLSPLVPCPLWRRLLALIYDLLAMLAIVLAVGYIAQRATGGQLFDRRGQALTWWYQPLQGLMLALYLVASWLRGGQTLGMRPWRLRLVGRDGGRPRWWQALIRLGVIAAPLMLLPLAGWLGWRAALLAALAGWVLWLAWALCDKHRRSVPDIAAGTLLIRLP
ncbi:MAG: RDD family protein [Dyella sp.]